MPLLFLLLVTLVGYSALTTGHFVEDFPLCSRQTGSDSAVRVSSRQWGKLSSRSASVWVQSWLTAHICRRVLCRWYSNHDRRARHLGRTNVWARDFSLGVCQRPGKCSWPGIDVYHFAHCLWSDGRGQIFGTLFFVLVTFAAVTSSISLLEPAVAWVGERLKLSRAKAATLVGAIAWLVGLGSAASFNVWKDATLPNGWNFFDVMDQISNNVLLPVGGILIALFSSWLLNKTILQEQLKEDTAYLGLWLWLARIVAPLGVMMVFAVTVLAWL